MWWLLDKAKFVWPVVVAYVIARAEIKRRAGSGNSVGLSAMLGA